MMARGGRLFWRMFWAFLLTLMVTAVVLSMMMVVMVREERKGALENEVRMQARDVAKLMQQFDLATIWRRDTALADTLDWKIEEIREAYNADVWLVSSARRVWVLGSNDYDQEQLNGEVVIQQIYKVLGGEEIRVQGLIAELGPHMVTIGVPWRDSAGWVGGAVLLHISTESLNVDYSDMIRNAAVATSVAMVLGTLLALFISQHQTRPIRQIKRAVTDFAGGQMDRRVAVKGDEDLRELADSFNQMAEELSGLEESRRSFVANVSHELRSPLTCVRGYVEGMLDGTIPEEDKQKYLKVVLLETKRLSKLVSELLDLSRIESGKAPLNLTNFDLCELMRLELIKFEGRIEEKGLDVEVTLPDGPLMVNADPDRIGQVATNLIDNAIKYSPDGGLIRLSLRGMDKVCRVEVFNTGAPIPAQELPRVFDRFYKVDKAHTSGRGTGLGLSIVKRILEQHGQKITATSDEAGTAFAFTLSRAERQEG